MKLRKLTKAAVANKTVILRAGFDVPIKNNKIIDDARIVDALETINFLIEQNCRIVIVTHLHRPKGKVVPELRLDLVAKRLRKLVKTKVVKINYSIGAGEEVLKLEPGQILMLENIRFHEEEESKSKVKRRRLAKMLAQYGDVFVNEAFSDCHRDHASITGIADFLPAYAGFSLYREVQLITKIMKKAKHPFVMILGGAKLGTKIPIIEHLLPKADKILVGGAMIFTFYAAQGISVGRSLVDKDELEDARMIMKKAKKKLVLPVDVVAATSIDVKAHTLTVHYDSIPESMLGVDIGHVTVEHFKKYLKNAKTIVWNGPMGIYEIKKFSHGTADLAHFVAKQRGTRVIGGGDIAEVIHELKLQDKMTLVSTGGGASLALFSGKKLPGLKPLSS